MGHTHWNSVRKLPDWLLCCLLLQWLAQANVHVCQYYLWFPVKVEIVSSFPPFLPPSFPLSLPPSLHYKGTDIWWDSWRQQTSAASEELPKGGERWGGQEWGSVHGERGLEAAARNTGWVRVDGHISIVRTAELSLEDSITVLCIYCVCFDMMSFIYLYMGRSHYVCVPTLNWPFTCIYMYEACDFDLWYHFQQCLWDLSNVPAEMAGWAGFSATLSCFWAWLKKALGLRWISHFSPLFGLRKQSSGHVGPPFLAVKFFSQSLTIQNLLTSGCS